ncbi:MAG: tetratricopeptide repeat protein [Nitrospirae bacterium]|nr:tetratricopeptide repeat protein [Nitrospirota bacterium]
MDSRRASLQGLIGVVGVVALLVLTTGPHGGRAQAEEAPNALEEGVTLLQQGHIPEAIDRLIRARDERPTVPAVWVALGQAYEAASRVAEAIDAYRRAIELMPQSNEAQWARRRLDQLGPDAETHEAVRRDFEAGVAAYRAGDLATAEADFRKVLDRLPKHLTGLLLLGTILNLSGRTDEARARWETAAAEEPTFYPAQVNLGRLYETTEEIAKAVLAYSAAVSTRAASSDVAFAARRLSQLGATPEQAMTVRGWLREADDALRAGRADDAGKLFAQVIAVLPTHAPANFATALLAAKRGQTVEAMALLKRGLEGDPDFYPALFLFGEIEAGQGRFKEAIGYFKRVAVLAAPRREGIEARRRIPGLEEAVNAQTVLEVGFRLEARKSFDEGIEAFQRREYDAAFHAFGKASVLDDQNPYYAFNRGLAAFNLNNNVVAAKSFERAVDLLPTYGLAHFWLALLFQASAQQARDNGNLPEAQAEYAAAVQKLDRAIEHGAQAWFLDEAKKRRAECLDFLSRYQEEAGSLAIGGLLVVQGRLQEAVTAFGRAAERLPWDFQPMLNLGAIFADQGAYDQARAALDRAIQISPRSPKPYMELGLLFERQKQIDDAVATYRKAAELAPDAPPPRISLGTLLQQKDDHVGAITEFEKAIQSSGGTSTPLVHFRLAFSYNLNGRLGLALQQYDKVLALLADRTEKEAVDLRNTASERAATLRRSLRPYTINFNVTPWSYDSNFNSSGTDPLGEVSTAVGGGIVYRLIDSTELQLTGGLNHSQNYYLVRSQTMNTSTGASLSTRYQVGPRVDLGGGYSWSYAHGSTGPQSIGQSLNGSVTKRGQLPSSMNLGLSYSVSEGLGAGTIKSAHKGYSLSLSQTLNTEGSMSLSYSASASDSSRADQVSQSKSFSLSYSRALWQVLSASWSYGLGFVDYVNPFTVAESRGGQRVQSLVSRKGESKNYGMALSYVFRNDLTVSFDVGYATNTSNVSIDNPEDLSLLLTNQVQAGGNFRKHTVSFSVSKSF